MKRLGFFLQLLAVGLLACQSITPTPSQTPMPTASATLTATKTPFKTATVARTPTVTAAIPVTATKLPLLSWDSTLKKGQELTYGADNSATIVCDSSKKTVGIIHHEFRMSIASPDRVTNLKVAAYQEEDQYKLLGLATEFCPMATIKFVARPNFTFGEWSSTLPKNWQYARVPNLLSGRSDYEQKPVQDPRKELLTWSIGQVVCTPYEVDPGNLPAGIDSSEPHVFQFTVLEDELDVNLLCGNRKDGVDTVWAYKFSLKDENADSEALHLLMSDAITWMMSTSADDKSMTVQDFSLGEFMNFARFSIEHDSVGEWISTPLSQFESKQ